MRAASDENIARRWCRVFVHEHENEDERVESLLSEPDKIRLYQERLSDISWLMWCLNEPLARRSNLEDGCKGRFWEGRFRSQFLADESAVYLCMAYVDLNPVRAGIVSTSEQSKYTSLAWRLQQYPVNQPIHPLNPKADQTDTPTCLGVLTLSFDAQSLNSKLMFCLFFST